MLIVTRRQHPNGLNVLGFDLPAELPKPAEESDITAIGQLGPTPVWRISMSTEPIGMSRREVLERADDLLEVGALTKGDFRRTLSGGMQRRLSRFAHSLTARCDPG